jgi:hypothetical protein
MKRLMSSRILVVLMLASSGAGGSGEAAEKFQKLSGPQNPRKVYGQGNDR